jgi:hypothetical protein
MKPINFHPKFQMQKQLPKPLSALHLGLKHAVTGLRWSAP